MKIGLVQINNSFSQQCYLPYSLGMLRAYFEQNSKLKNGEFLPAIFSRIDTDEAAEKLSDADVVLFSLYVWNARISFEIAEKLKKKKPGIVLVFGGPQVPDRIEGFLQKYDFIDFAIHGEGEQAFCELYDSNFSKESKSVSYLNDGKIITNPKLARIKDINTIPSPYLWGAFDDIMEIYPDQKWVACWETDRGCPFSCTYCDWGSATQAKVNQFDIERIFKEVDWFSERKIDFVFCCNANFGMLKRDIEIAQYVADVKVKTNFPKRLSVQNTKNATERSYLVQKILSDFGLNKGVTLSMQSVDKTTLENIKRDNISLASYQTLQERFVRDGVETYTDLILPLPGETYDSFVNGINTVISNGQHNRIQFNNLSILPNAQMAEPEYMAKFGMVTIESNIVNMHGSLSDSEHAVLEKQELVISTNTMPREDWVKARALAWAVNFMYFNKVFQIPIIIFHKLTGISYKSVFESFMTTKIDGLPILKEIRDFFIEKAKDIANGGEEYCLSKEYLDIFWPPDELMLIRLVYDKKIDAFYDEISAFIKSLVGLEYVSIFSTLDDAVLLNKSLLKLPNMTEDLAIESKFNIWPFYKGVLRGEEIAIEEVPGTIKIDRTTETWNTTDDYCREVIWYGNKMGAYLYGNPVFDERLAGIH